MSSSLVASLYLSCIRVPVLNVFYSSNVSRISTHILSSRPFASSLQRRSWSSSSSSSSSRLLSPRSPPRVRNILLSRSGPFFSPRRCVSSWWSSCDHVVSRRTPRRKPLQEQQQQQQRKLVSVRGVVRSFARNVSSAKMDSSARGSGSSETAMQPLLQQVHELVESALESIRPGCGHLANVQVPRKGEAEIQISSAMAFFAAIKGTEGAPKSPKDAAQMIIDALPANHLLMDLSITGPGFIMGWFRPEEVTRQVQTYILDRPSGSIPCPVLSSDYSGRRVVIDYSSPNIAKEMHVGHLRSTIIGESLSRILEYCGNEVIRINHVGDWGTQFGMLICYLKELHPDFLDHPPPISDLVAFYKKAKARFDDDEDFKRRSREEVVSLQSGDETNLLAWRMLCDVSREEFSRIYERLGVSRLEERGESFYNDRMHGMVEELEQRSMLEDDCGARVMRIPGKAVPLMVRKGDGGYTYDTTDLCAVRHRVYEEQANWLVYVVDMGQSEHFQLVFSGAEIAGFFDPSLVRIEHVGFGLVLGPDGKKLKTRSGETVRLADLLDEAVERSANIIRGRVQAMQSSTSAESSSASTEVIEEDDLAGSSDLVEEADIIPEEEIMRRAAAIGYSAVKYTDLKNNRTTDYRFSFDQMLSLKGNSAVYLMYAYARIRSIIRKTGVDVEGLIAGGTVVACEHHRERALCRELLFFPDAVRRSIQSLAPHHICEYLYGLSNVFNEFFRDCRVKDHENQNSRLLLCEATTRVMAKAFDLVGLAPLERI